mgnify:CR=1 FL=1
MPAIAKPPPYLFGWSDLSPFTQGYIEALFATFSAEFQKEWGASNLQVRFSDLAPETLAGIIADCEAAATARGSDGYEATGREFWMVRQAGLIADFPPLTIHLGDDGKVRFADPARSEERRAGE